MALKKLFGKLVTEYGDDAAKLIATKGDDVARAVATKGDDVLRAADKVDDFLPPASVPNLQAQQNLKNDLIYKRSPADHFDFIEPPATTSKASAEFVEGFNNPMTWGKFPRYTKTLGSVDSDLYDIGDSIKPKGSAVSVPEIPTSGLVVNRGQGDDWRTRGFELRPHKNTALGKWYGKNVIPVDSARSNPDFFDGFDEVSNLPIDFPYSDVDAPDLIQSDAYGVRSIDGWTYHDGLLDAAGPREDLIDSVDFPDGFTSPDSFARYHDAVELGYYPAEFEAGLWDDVHRDEVNSMVLAHNLLKQQELNMPMSPRTFEQAKMLVNKYLEPGYWATKNPSIPNQRFVRQHKLDGTLYDLYDRILKAF